MTTAYIIALLCGFAVTLASMFVKRATSEGAGITRVFFIANWLFFIGMLPLLFTDLVVLDWSQWWSPLVTSLCAFLAGICILASIKAGEISVQTPLMGTKVIFVATYSVFLVPSPIPTSWWIGAFLTFFAILLLGLTDLFRKKISFWGVFYAILSSALYALTDVLTAREAPLFGRWPFLLMMGMGLAVLSLTLIPFFRKSLFSISKHTWMWCLLGGGCLAGQHLGLLYALSTYGEATAINVLYSTRVLWGIVLVWFTGHWFKNHERHVGGQVIVRRLIGACLMLMAIIIVITNS